VCVEGKYETKRFGLVPTSVGCYGKQRLGFWIGRDWIRASITVGKQACIPRAYHAPRLRRERAEVSLYCVLTTMYWYQASRYDNNSPLQWLLPTSILTRLGC
jgi:hypothetical protein